MITTGAQIRAARAALSWSRKELAGAAGVHLNAIAYWEAKATIYPSQHLGSGAALRLIEAALMRAGILLFVNPTPGLRMCRQTNF
jgi:transcriptional regulator with XRE-family HTH domain